MKVKFESYDQYIISLVKRKILKDTIIYFDNNTQLMEFIYLRYNINSHQIEFDNYLLHLNNKLGERFATIGKILKY